MPKAFGKFDLKETLPLRPFEVYLKINSREGTASWKSAYISVQKLLNHLLRYTKSEASREKYLRHLCQFSRWSHLDSDKLTKLPRKRVEMLVQDFADGLAAQDRSRSYVNTVIKRLRTFFRVNGFNGNQELKVHGYFVPTRYRKIPEYIPNKTEVFAMADESGSRRDRAVILALWSTGLRVSTFCALNYSDVVNELNKTKSCLMVRVYPEMKERVEDSCKGLIPYYTFMCLEAVEALRSYLAEREEKYGDVDLDFPLFHSDWTLWAKEERSRQRLGRRAIGLIVKRAAKFAGIQQWKFVTPHCLRKAFESVLRSPTTDGGRLDKGTQEFFMGHILPNTQDVYYDKTKVEFHRQEYSKLDFSRASKIFGKTKDKLVNIEKLEMYLDEGWQFVAKISDMKAIVRKGD